VGKITEKAVGRSACLLIQRSKYGAMLSKIHYYRLLFQQFCLLGNEMRKINFRR